MPRVQGGGEVTLTARSLAPGGCLPPLNLVDRGAICKVTLRAFAAGGTPAADAAGMVAAAEKGLRQVRNHYRIIGANATALVAGSHSLESLSWQSSTALALPCTCSRDVVAAMPVIDEAWTVPTQAGHGRGLEFATFCEVSPAGGTGSGLTITVETDTGCILGAASAQPSVQLPLQLLIPGQRTLLLWKDLIFNLAEAVHLWTLSTAAQCVSAPESVGPGTS